jgi:hypothetical protein
MMADAPSTTSLISTSRGAKSDLQVIIEQGDARDGENAVRDHTRVESNSGSGSSDIDTPAVTNVTAAMNRLGQALADAKQKHADSPDGGREAALMAVGGVCEFIESVDQFRALGLVTPLALLGVALTDIDRGAVAPLLQKRRLGRRAPETHVRQYVKAHAAATMHILMEIGFRRREAAESVADLLRHHGVSLAGGFDVTWRTVAGWRDSLEGAPGEDQAAVAYREMIAGHGARTADMRHGIKLGKVNAAQVRGMLLAGLTSVIEQTGEG